ncbi:hypothetical protein C8R45DRAFT_543592 [Mycena sanguinolenta]|nr:hypothetical protein C8R45DRAFT_543592 [Mycena sanguinolenta]
MALCVFSARPRGVLVTLALLFLRLSSPSAAQTVTGTLYGIAYPTNYVQLTNDAYSYGIFEYLWIGNDPQITILGTGTDGQTTFGYHDVYTQSQENLGGTSTATATLITEAGTLVQGSAGLYYDGSFAAETCSFGPEATAGPAECVFGITIGGVAATVTGSITPFFTYIAALPTSTPTSGSKSGSGSPPTDTSSRTALPNHKVPVGAIVGGVIGGLAVIGVVLAFLLWRRPRKHRYSMREKNKLDLEHGLDPVSSTVAVTTAGSATTAAPPPEMRRDHRKRLKQMQDTVLQLRNISITEPAVESESASQQQVAPLLEEIERLRAIIAHDEALPVYEQ